MSGIYISGKVKVYVWSMVASIVGVLIVMVIVLMPSGGDESAQASSKSPVSTYDGTVHEYSIDEAPEHIGEKAVIHGEIKKAFVSKTGTTFFDFCDDFRSCPFSAVIFASDAEKFGDISQYQREVSISGVLRSYDGKAEIILNDPSQID